MELAEEWRERRVRPADKANPLRIEGPHEAAGIKPVLETPKPTLLRLLDHVSAGLRGERRQREVAHRDPSSVGERNDSASAT